MWGDFWDFHIDIVVSCIDHENEMETNTNQRGLGLTLKGSSSPNICIVFKHKKARNYPSKSQMKTLKVSISSRTSDPMEGRGSRMFLYRTTSS